MDTAKALQLHVGQGVKFKSGPHAGKLAFIQRLMDTGTHLYVFIPDEVAAYTRVKVSEVESATEPVASAPSPTSGIRSDGAATPIAEAITRTMIGASTVLNRENHLDKARFARPKEAQKD